MACRGHIIRRPPSGGHQACEDNCVPSLFPSPYRVQPLQFCSIPSFGGELRLLIYNIRNAIFIQNPSKTVLDSISDRFWTDFLTIFGPKLVFLPTCQ